MSNARNIARLLPNASGQLPDANLSAIAASKLSGQVPASNAVSGSVIQVVKSTFLSGVSTSSTTYVTTGHSLVMTPKFATSKLLVRLVCNLSADSNSGATFGLQYAIFRDGSQMTDNGQGSSIFYYGAGDPTSNRHTNQSCEYLVNSNAASSTTFDVRFKINQGGNLAKYHGDWGTCLLSVTEVAA